MPRKPTRRPRRAALAPPRTVTRRDYAELVVRLGATELQVKRHRAAIEQQARLITQMQAQLDALKTVAAAQTLAHDLAALPLPTPPTVES